MDKLAKSLAGHDKDHVYVVVKEDDSNVYLADGHVLRLYHTAVSGSKH